MQALFTISHRQAEIKFCRPTFIGQATDLKTLQSLSRPPRVVQLQRDLEKGRATQIPFRLEHLDQLLKGYILVRIRSQARLTHLLEQFTEAGIA